MEILGHPGGDDAGGSVDLSGDSTVSLLDSVGKKARFLEVAGEAESARD